MEEDRHTKKAKRLGDTLVEAGVVTPDQLEIALAEQKRTGIRLGTILSDLGVASEEAVSRALATQSGVAFYDLDRIEIEPNAVRCVPEEIARRHILIPIRLDKDTLVVAMANPADILAIDEIERASDLYVEAATSSKRQILRAIDSTYANQTRNESAIEAAIRRACAQLDEEDEDGSEGGVVALFDELLALALRRDATDLHFEPDRKVLRVRLRVDGELIPGPTLPASLLAGLVARVKILASLNIAEARIPQDGKMRRAHQNRTVDLRVSTFPCVHGESVVIRILDTGRKNFSLESIGLASDQIGMLEKAAARPNGLLLAAGPTGSGKTTTLYALLRSMDNANKKVVTLEDPVEYEMPMAAQCQVNEKSGLTFAAGLRSILRHDPDVILVGEMRDHETCEMAFRAALTGHIVLSTIHTNDSIRSVSRLRDIGIEPFMIASCLAAVSAQRLVRLVCPHCKVPAAPRADELEAVGLTPDAVGDFARGEGCPQCHGTGSKGREALFEVLEVTAAVSEVIGRDGSLREIEEAARASGLVTFREQACRKAAAGQLTLDEVARVTADY